MDLPSKGWRLSSSWLGRTGPPLGPASPSEGAETDPSPLPLHCDWAYKPGGKGVAEAQAKWETKGGHKGHRNQEDGWIREKRKLGVELTKNKMQGGWGRGRGKKAIMRCLFIKE